jgi:hypothetical protein
VVEFMFYGFAVGMAVKEHDSAYYAGEQGAKLRDFIRWSAQRSLDIQQRALQRRELSEGDSRNVEFLTRFRASAETADMRAWVKSDLGEDLSETIARANVPSSSDQRADARPARRTPRAG